MEATRTIIKISKNKQNKSVTEQGEWKIVTSHDSNSCDMDSSEYIYEYLTRWKIEDAVIPVETMNKLSLLYNEIAARDFLEKSRWGEHVSCPYCKTNSRIKRRGNSDYLHCSSCNSDFTVRTNTILRRSHIPLNKWMHGICLFVIAKKLTSVRLANELGTTQKSAWVMHQKFKSVCKNPPKTVDEFLVKMFDENEI